MSNARPPKVTAPPKLGPRPATRDHLRSGKKPLTMKHEVVLENEVADRLRQLRAEYELAEAQFKVKPDDKERQAAFDQAEAAYREVQEEAAEHVVVITLRGMGRHRFDLLKRSHPPTDQDKADAERVGIDVKALEFSPATFPPAVIAGSMVEPEMTEDEVRAEIWDSDSWNAAEAQGLYLAAMTVNQARSSVDLGKASGATRASG